MRISDQTLDYLISLGDISAYRAMMNSFNPSLTSYQGIWAFNGIFYILGKDYLTPEGKTIWFQGGWENHES